MNVTGTCIHSLSFTLQLSSGLIVPYSPPAGIGFPNIPGAQLQYPNGTGALAVDQIYSAKLVLAATTTTIDMTAVTWLDGSTAAAGRVREWVLFNPDAAVGHIVKAYATASNGVTFLPPVANYDVATGLNGSIRKSDPNSTGAGNGYYVDSTHKTFTLDPGANTVTVYLVMGCSSVE